MVQLGSLPKRWVLGIKTMVSGLAAGVLTCPASLGKASIGNSVAWEPTCSWFGVPSPSRTALPQSQQKGTALKEGLARTHNFLFAYGHLTVLSTRKATWDRRSFKLNIKFVPRNTIPYFPEPILKDWKDKNKVYLWPWAQSLGFRRKGEREKGREKRKDIGIFIWQGLWMLSSKNVHYVHEIEGCVIFKDFFLSVSVWGWCGVYAGEGEVHIWEQVLKELGHQDSCNWELHTAVSYSHPLEEQCMFLAREPSLQILKFYFVETGPFCSAALELAM